MEEKKAIFWCSCGLSSKTPYCDGSHRGTEKRPVKVDDLDLKKRICVCQKTKEPPYCDGSHAE